MKTRYTTRPDQQHIQQAILRAKEIRQKQREVLLNPINQHTLSRINAGDPAIPCKTLAIYDFDYLSYKYNRKNCRKDLK